MQESLTLKELRIKLAEKEKTAVWLAAQLGYSTKRLYQVIQIQRQEDIKKIKEILK